LRVHEVTLLPIVTFKWSLGPRLCFGGSIFIMPDVRTGIDLIEIERFEKAIERHGYRFVGRIFTSREINEVGENKASLAARFAAKEAVAKALGTGIGVISWHEIEILRGAAREPLLRLHGSALNLAQELHMDSWSISLSHSQTHAIALAVFIGGN
jgi:holo-[acyl-carrier protein] synthase